MSLSLWALFTLLSRITLYASVASAIGGLFASVLLVQHRESATAIRRYTFWGCMAGIIATLIGFGTQVGALSDQGLKGMLDTDMMAILWQASMGTAVALQLSGFLLIGAAVGWLLKTQPPHNTLVKVLTLLGGLSLLASFSQVGHFAEQPLLGKVAITLHVLAMSLWMGSLYPLWLVSRTAETPEIQRSMERFGQVATIIVGVLVASGVLMAVMLLKDFHTLFFTPYGQGLLLKLTLVGSLLLLAASNKWLTVPRLMQPGFSTRLSRAIAFEMCVGAFILLITGIITIIIGIDMEH
jgi:putative copper resistance protein D